VDLHREYRDKGFEILAFPCDQFLSQEPGSNSDIKKLIKDKFRAEFPLFEKSEINGPNTCDVYKYLRYNTEALYDPENDVVQEVPWNFSKFIVDGHTGQVISYYNPRVSPHSLRKEIESIIKRNTEEHGEFISKVKYKTKEELEKEVPDTSAGCGTNDACAKKQVVDDAENRV
jgi:glutathione peroxidase